MIIDLTTKTEVRDTNSEIDNDIPEFYAFDRDAYDEWKIYVRSKCHKIPFPCPLEDRISIVKEALLDPHMRGVLWRSFGRKIRSEAISVIVDFKEANISALQAASRIVDLDILSQEY